MSDKQFGNKSIYRINGKWVLHSYYTICPLSPDGSGRVLAAAADLEAQTGEVVIFSSEGQLLDSFGKNSLNPGFWHTGFWQTWSSDGRFVYYQAGTLSQPQIARYDTFSGESIKTQGDIEGAPPNGEPLISGLMGMLYAAGYGTGIYNPEIAPVPFQERDKHGLFEFSITDNSALLRKSINRILDNHPFRDYLLNEDIKTAQRLSSGEKLTLMAYCVRWNPAGDRFLFYFGNHCVDKKRGEPRIAYVMTADRSMKEIYLAVNLSQKSGVHWSWHPDGCHLIGYGPDPDEASKMCIAQVKYDGTGYKRISRNNTGGHPGISPVNHNILVTDEYKNPGEILFINLTDDTILASESFSHALEGARNGRTPDRVDLHPVFSSDGKQLFFNCFNNKLSQLCSINITEVLSK